MDFVNKNVIGGTEVKIVGIVGTNSTHSTNRQLLKFMAKHFNKQAEFEIVEIKKLPVFNEPENRTAPKEVQKLSDEIMSADGVIISTPEYDHSIPAVLKNAIE